MDHRGELIEGARKTEIHVRTGLQTRPIQSWPDGYVEPSPEFVHLQKGLGLRYVGTG